MLVFFDLLQFLNINKKNFLQSICKKYALQSLNKQFKIITRDKTFVSYQTDVKVNSHLENLILSSQMLMCFLWRTISSMKLFFIYDFCLVSFFFITSQFYYRYYSYLIAPKFG